MTRSLLALLTVLALGACSGSGDGLGGFLTADPRGLSSGKGGSAPPPGAPAANMGEILAGAIEEANLYRVDDDRLFLLNAWRGFTVVDLAGPTLLGNLPLGGMPVEMYLRGERAFVLVSSFEGETEVVEIALADPANLVRVATHAIAGEYRTSRMNGDVLLVLAGEALHSFTVEPALAPADSAALPGAQFAHATAERMYVAAPEEPSGTRVTLVDVSDPAGDLVPRGSVSLPGYVTDEFKLHFGAGHLRVVTHDWEQSQLSRLFMVDVSDPDAPYVRSSLDIVKDEQLFATRFDEQTAYIVTFEIIDPLWIVDLSDPDQPQLVSSLEVPGYSTHLVALPGRLVALGLDPDAGWSAIASVFDVSDPAHPLLASRVDFGQGWSSAFDDVKGFGVFEDEGFVLVPFSSESEHLAVLSLAGNDLALEGWIDTEGTVLRGFPHERGLCALSTEELVVADPATLAVSGRVTIAQNVVDATRLAPLAHGALVEVVQRAKTCRVGEVELPMWWLTGSYVHEDAVVVTGWDGEDTVAYVVDFASVPPAVSPRIEIGTSPMANLPSGWIVGPGYAARGVVTSGGRLVLPGLVAGKPDVTVGDGELQDGFTVIDIEAARVEATVGVRDAFVTGFLAERELLVFTYGWYVGDDPEGRPLMRHKLARLDLDTLSLGYEMAVPGYVVRYSGGLVHTIEETWDEHWSFDVAVVACELDKGNAKVLDRLDLPQGAYDLRAPGDTLWYSTYGDVVVGHPGGPNTGTGTSGSAGPDGGGASAKIGTVRLGPHLSFGPKLAYEEHFASLLFAEEQSALVVVDGLALDRWELGAGPPVLSWSHELGSWPQSARPDDSVPGSYVLALGYGGSLVVP
jgi:hypothetical protein